MKKYILSIEGMVCSMCEAHINDTVRNTIPGAKKVSSSHKKGECVFLAESIPEEVLRKAIEATGYHLEKITAEEVKRKGLFG